MLQGIRRLAYNFNDPEEKILKALYDRFDLKIQTEYVRDKANRMAMLRKKQSKTTDEVKVTISLSELEEMQREVKGIKIPDSINELMDAVLLELRKKGIEVSDRTFFGFGNIVRAEAFLNGRTEVIPKDLLALKNYLWNKPEEITAVAEALKRICENPLGDRINKLTAAAFKIRDGFTAADNKNKALMSVKTELLKLYNEALDIKKEFGDTDAAVSGVDSFISTLEDISRGAYSETSFTYVSLPELKEYTDLQK